jgi:hypothetical protein
LLDPAAGIINQNSSVRGPPVDSVCSDTAL